MTVIYQQSALNPVLVAARSRKTHTGVGDFDIDIDIAQAIGGSVTVEPRTNTVDHRIYFRFDRPIINAGVVTSLDSVGGALGTPAITSIIGAEVLVTISGAPDIKRAVITLTGVNESTTAVVNMGFLIGDQNDSRTITGTDVGILVGRQGQPVTLFNFKSNINLSGTVDASDQASTQANSGQSI